ncbi:unnamed protein product [Brachionus calyciflorus]|uniref:Uncharacterized protein n=1 Tax=Brachionus calyciflorus TaxID=104777 RepID=A0A814PCM2_9BILA|nr:unnamed protein product [Brachionus calyciflorus]
MWKKIQELGLSVEYRSNREIYGALNLPQFLAYIPCEDVLSGFEEIKNHVNLKDKRLKDFYDYFGANYFVVYEVKRGRYNKIIQVEKEPRFPVKLWSIHGRIIDNIPRTNNFCESLHNAFSGLLNSHPWG